MRINLSQNHEEGTLCGNPAYYFAASKRSLCEVYISLIMKSFTMVTLMLLSSTSGLALAAPSLPTIPESSISQSILPNVTSDLTAPGLPEYEDYKIPNTDLTIHLTLLQTLDRVAMEACLTTAILWVTYQRPTVDLPKRDFEWKDGNGALFYIKSLSRRLTWGDVKSALRGLKEDLFDEARYFAASFTLEDRSAQQFIASGRLSRYTPPAPDGPVVTAAATS